MSFPLNILLVSADFKPGLGHVAEYGHQIASHLQRGGDRVTVLAGRKPGEEAFDAGCDYEVLRAECPLISGSPDLQVAACLPEWLRVLEYVARVRRADCLMCNSPFPMGLYAALVAQRLCLPYIVAVHGPEVANPAALGLRPIQKDYALRRADRVLCLSRCAWSRVAEQGVSPDRLALIPGGVDPDAFQPARGGARIRARFGLNGHRMVLTPNEGDGVGRVIAALGVVLEGTPDAFCVVAGGGPCEGAWREQAARSPAVRGHVLFAGPVADGERADFYNACDVFAAPCRSAADAEGFGAAFLEANACGKPVVAGRSGNAPEGVLDGYNGLLVDPWDLEDVAYGLSMLLTDRDYARRLGENGLRWVREELSWEKVAARVREEIRRAVEYV